MGFGKFFKKAVGVLTPPGLPNPVNVAEKTAEVIKKPTLSSAVSLTLSTVPVAEKAVEMAKNPDQVLPISPQQLADDLKNLIKDPVETLIEVITRETLKAAGIMDKVVAVIKIYLDYLDSQSEGKLKKLPEELITALQPLYTINLREVRYAENIDTKQDGVAVTVLKKIYFPCDIDPIHDNQHLEWLLHELTHVQQYQRLNWSVNSFLENYSAMALVEMIRNGTFNPHDQIRYEKDAINNAHQLLEEARVALPSSPQPSH